MQISLSARAEARIPNRPAQQAFRRLRLAFNQRLAALSFGRMTQQESVQAASQLIDIYRQMQALSPDAERDRIIDLPQDIKGVGVSYFFRQRFDGPELDALLAHLKQSGRQTVRVFVAGCSSGQEAFSWAMLLDRGLPPGMKAEIFAVDGDILHLERALFVRDNFLDLSSQRGLYSFESRPAGYHDYFIHLEGQRWQFKPEITEAVQFGLLDINKYDPKLVGDFDIVSCANVFRHYCKWTLGFGHSAEIGYGQVVSTHDRLRASLREDTSLFYVNFRRSDWFIVNKPTSFRDLVKLDAARTAGLPYYRRR